MIELHTLGRIDLTGVEDDAARAVVRAPKRLGLLSYLALAGPGDHVRRDTLVTLFWPDQDGSRARHALRNTLYELRQALGGRVVRGRGKQELAVDPEHLRCDAVAFRQALAEGRRREALELYRGELLRGFHVQGAAPTFERWLEEERRSLRRGARRAANELCAAAEDDGRSSEAVRWAERSLELDSFDESVVRRLMRLWVASGNRGAALRVYRDFADRLESRLGLEPDPETRELVEQIRSSGVGRFRVEDAPEVAASGSHAPGVPEGPESEPGQGPADGSPAEGEPGGTPVPAPERAEETGRSGFPAWKRPGGVFLAVLLAATAVWLGTRAVGSSGSEAEGGATATMTSLSGERVAVLPFRVQGEDGLRFLGDGLASLLASGLDGAGGLRTVDPRALASRAEELDGPVDTETASSVAEELDAGLYVLGTAFASGENVRLIAALYRRGSSTPVARTEVEGARDGALRLIDRLAAELLASAYPQAQLRLVRQAGRTTRSLEALKAYLTGEQAFRRGRFAAASEAYQRAVGLDSAFALAHHRLSVTSEWLGNRELARQAAESAVRHSERLVERDRRLLEAHLTSLEGNADEAEDRYRAILATWPHDLEAWYQLGEIVFHYGPAVGRSISEAGEAFGRVRSLHPTHVPSLVHLARIAASEGHLEALTTLAQRVRSLVPDSRHAWEMRALAAFLAGDVSDRAQIVDGLRDTGGQAVRLAAWSVAAFGGRLDAARRLTGLMIGPERSPEIRQLGHTWRAELSLARGRWRHVWRRLAGPATGDEGPEVDHPRALFASLEFLTLPDSVLRGARRRLGGAAGGSVGEEGFPTTPPGTGGPEPALSSLLRDVGLALLCSRLGDHETALSGAARLERTAGSAPGLPLAERLGRIVRAHVAWQRGEAERALELLGRGGVETRSAFMYGSELVQPFERYLRARLLADAGRTEASIRLFGTFANQHVPHLVFLAPSHFHRARLLERLGRDEAARRHYRAFLELWRRPDPELRPMRSQAQRRLTSLDGETSGRG